MELIRVKALAFSKVRRLFKEEFEDIWFNASEIFDVDVRYCTNLQAFYFELTTSFEEHKGIYLPFHFKGIPIQPNIK